MDWEHVLRDSANANGLKSLEKQLRSPLGVIPFVGAGISVPLGFPGWTNFLQQEAKNAYLEHEIDPLIASGRYEAAAERLRNGLGLTDFEDTIERRFGPDLLPNPIPDESLAFLLTGIASGPVITTNFDHVLERCFEQARRPFQNVIWGSKADFVTKALQEDRHFLLKMHGDVATRADRVLTEAEYVAHYGEWDRTDFTRELPRALKRIFESRHLLFVGCSLNNDRTLAVLKDAVESSNSRHYALVEKPSDKTLFSSRRQYLGNLGIRCVWFPEGCYEYLPPLLQHLATMRPGATSAPHSAVNVPRVAAASATPPVAPASASTGPRHSPVYAPGSLPDSVDYWKHRAWSHRVHEYLDERLLFLLVRVRPYQMHRAVAQLTTLVDRKGYGSVRAYELFGTYDLLIRAWVPVRLSTEFQNELKEVLAGCKAVHGFQVERVLDRWYYHGGESSTAEGPSLFKRLHQQSIAQIESGASPKLYSELLAAKLVFERPPAQDNSILFFVTVNFHRDLSLDALKSAEREIEEYLVSLNDRVIRTAVDLGLGFCQILIRGEGASIYDISKVPDWISTHFQDDEVEPETYISKRIEPIYASSKIGRSTMISLSGRDLFAESILPEISNGNSAQKEAVLDFLKRGYVPADLSTGGRRFLRDYLLQVLAEDQGGIAAVIFHAYRDWERYLRSSHREFVGRMGMGCKQIYDAAKVRDEKNISLADLFQIYWQSLNGHPDREQVSGNWGEFVNVRNVIDHGKDQFNEWPDYLREILGHWSRIGNLLRLIANAIGKPFAGRYGEDGPHEEKES